jgi:hypothetical protein
MADIAGTRIPVIFNASDGDFFKSHGVRDAVPPFFRWVNPQIAISIVSLWSAVAAEIEGRSLSTKSRSLLWVAIKLGAADRGGAGGEDQAFAR